MSEALIRCLDVPAGSAWTGTPFAVRMRSWGDETVVYHCGSAETVLLDEPSSWVLARLGDNPVFELTLTNELTHSLGGHPDEVAELIRATLIRLASLGLANRFAG